MLRLIIAFVLMIAGIAVFQDRLLYFPDTTDGATARRHIMEWIKRCEPLWNELQRLGYQNRSQYFPPRQVSTIFEYLGEPGAE